jgi:hypothetical protein
VTTYRVTFRVGDDRERILTAVTVADDERHTSDVIRQKIAAAGITSPHQFPASAVRILSVRPV